MRSGYIHGMVQQSTYTILTIGVGFIKERWISKKSQINYNRKTINKNKD